MRESACLLVQFWMVRSLVLQLFSWPLDQRWIEHLPAVRRGHVFRVVQQYCVLGLPCWKIQHHYRCQLSGGVLGLQHWDVERASLKILFLTGVLNRYVHGLQLVYFCGFILYSACLGCRRWISFVRDSS